MAKTKKVVTKEDVIRQDKKRAERLAKKKLEEEIKINELQPEENIEVNNSKEEIITEVNNSKEEIITEVIETNEENITTLNEIPTNWLDVVEPTNEEIIETEKKKMPIRYVNVCMGKILD